MNLAWAFLGVLIRSDLFECDDKNEFLLIKALLAYSSIVYVCSVTYTCISLYSFKH